jgi:hypothetical protein
LLPFRPSRRSRSRDKEATLIYHFRPIFTFRATFVGATPVIRVRRALARIDTLPPGQMEQPIELTPFTADGKRGYQSAYRGVRPVQRP